MADELGARADTSPAGRARRETLAGAFDPHANGFGLLRFVLAFVVIVAHTFPLGGFGDGRDPLDRYGASLGSLAVCGFFVISGFLVARSLLTCPSTLAFLWRRFLRVFPGFWVCLLVTAFGFGLLAWRLEHGSVAGYLAATPSAVGYVLANSLLRMSQWDIGGLLEGNPLARSAGSAALNGSLWTLFYEFVCYLGLAGLGAVGIARRSRRTVAVVAAGLWAAEVVERLAPGALGRLGPLFTDPWFRRLGLLFLLGVLAFLYADRVPASGRVALVAGLAFAASVPLGLSDLVGIVPLAYLLLWVAVRRPLHRFEAAGNLSYGLYIYAFPVQQLAASYRVDRFGAPAYLAACTAVVLVLAALSWRLVEEPSLRLKRLRLRSPGWRRAGAAPVPAPVPAHLEEAEVPAPAPAR